MASDAPADLARRPATLALDWFYLGVHAFADATSPRALWVARGGFTLLLLALPWLSRAARAPRPAAAVVDLANCNGCARCFADCPYAAVTMRPRTDGKHLPRAGRRRSRAVRRLRHLRRRLSVVDAVPLASPSS